LVFNARSQVITSALAVLLRFLESLHAISSTEGLKMVCVALQEFNMIICNVSGDKW